MTLTLDLTPELESRLRDAAARHGLEASEYALRLVEQSLPAPALGGPSLWNTLTPQEWQKAFEEWAESHDRSIPPLPDEAVSRESFYEGRL